MCARAGGTQAISRRAVPIGAGVSPELADPRDGARDLEDGDSQDRADDHDLHHDAEAAPARLDEERDREGDLDETQDERGDAGHEALRREATVAGLAVVEEGGHEPATGLDRGASNLGSTAGAAAPELASAALSLRLVLRDHRASSERASTTATAPTMSASTTSGSPSHAQDWPLQPRKRQSHPHASRAKPRG